MQDLHRGLMSDSRRSGKATEPLGRRSVREVNEPGGAKASATNKEEASGFDRRGVPVSRVGEVDCPDLWAVMPCGATVNPAPAAHHLGL